MTRVALDMSGEHGGEHNEAGLSALLQGTRKV